MPQIDDAAKVEVANLVPKADMGFFSDPKANAPEKPKAAVEPVKVVPPKDPETGRFVKPEQVPPTKEKHSQEALDAASFFGLSEDSVADIPPHKLNMMLLRMQQQHMQQQKQDNLQRMFDDSQAKTAAVKPKDDYEEFGDIDLGTDDTGEKIDIRSIHPGILRLLRAKLQPIGSKVEEMANRDISRETATNNEIIDEAIESLGAEYEAFLGKGSLTDHPPGSIEHVIRMTAAGSAGIDWQKDSRKTKQRKYIERVKDMLKNKVAAKPATVSYENATPTPAEKRFTVEDFAQGGLNPPTSREQEELPDGEEKAIRHIEKKYGLKNGTNRKEIMDGMFKG